MLSRIAESLYWIGRYVERAEDTARILDVHFHLLVEDRSTDGADSYRTLLHAMGLPHVADVTDGSAVASLLIRNERFDGSIASSIGSAWDNAHGARRDHLVGVVGVPQRDSPQHEPWDRAAITRTRPCAGSRSAPAMAAGLVDTTMSRDDGWRFLVLGRSVERADMTVRLLSARYGERWGAAGWRVLLRCCSAHEAFLRRHQGQFDARARARVPPHRRRLPPLRALLAPRGGVVRGRARRGLGLRRRGGEAHRLLARAAADLSYTSVPSSPTIWARASRSSSACAAPRTKPSPAGTSGPVRPSSGALEHVVATLDHPPHRLRVRGRGRRVVQPGPPHARPRVTASCCSTTRSPSIHAVAVFASVDYWGTRVHTFDVHVPHQRLEVTGKSLVETASTGPWPDALEWGVLEDEAIVDELCEYLVASPMTRADEAVAALAASFRAGRSPIDTVAAAIEWVREEVAYEQGVTSVETPATGVLAARRGVCQDFAHLTIASAALGRHPRTLRLRLPASR